MGLFVRLPMTYYMDKKLGYDYKLELVSLMLVELEPSKQLSSLLVQGVAPRPCQVEYGEQWGWSKLFSQFYDWWMNWCIKDELDGGPVKMESISRSAGPKSCQGLSRPTVVCAVH